MQSKDSVFVCNLNENDVVFRVYSVRYSGIFFTKVNCFQFFWGFHSQKLRRRRKQACYHNCTLSSGQHFDSSSGQTRVPETVSGSKVRFRGGFPPAIVFPAVNPGGVVADGEIS